MQKLQELLAPLPVELFFNEFWTRTHTIVEGPSSKFAALFGWHDMNCFLNDHRQTLAPHHVRVVRNGFVLPTSGYFAVDTTRSGQCVHQLDSDRLIRHFYDGATIVLTNLEHWLPELSRLARTLSEELDEPVHINAYCSPPEAMGFGLHYDTHEVLILQIDGAKRWKISEVTRQFPLARDKSLHYEAPTEVREEVVITQGGLLYLPRGLWHHAATAGSVSLHLTIGVRCRTVNSFHHWLADLASDEPSNRRNLKQQHPRECHTRDRLVAATRQLIVRLEELLSDPESLEATFKQRGEREDWHGRPFALPE